MSETNFKPLQQLHESMLQKQQTVSEENQQDFIKEVREYIEQAKRAGSNISSTRERDQVRANLRYWANYVYSIEKTFPDTELAPSMIENKQPALRLIIIISFFIIAALSGIQIYRSSINGLSEKPTNTPIFAETKAGTTPSIETPGLAPPTEASIPESSGYNVILESPANLENITPNAEFSGFYENLKPGWAIHVLFIKEDKFFPSKINYLIPEKPNDNKWKISTQLTESVDELSKPQSYSVVLAVSLDNSSRDLLSNSSENGIDINSMPPTVIRFDNTARVIFRDKGYTKVEGTRLVFSKSENKTPYDLYTSGPNGEEERQITFTLNVSELSPNISPDGTKIAYVHLTPNTNIYSIHIMDSNGENDHKITDDTRNILESPQWSPDSSYISYAMSDISQSLNRASWNIHYCKIRTLNEELIIEEMLCESSSQKDETVLEEPRSFVQPYHTWLPDMNSIVFEARPQLTGTTGFDIKLIEPPGEPAHFFDTEEDDIQPNIKSLDNGYLLTYTIVRADKKHDTWAALIVSDQHFPFNGFKIRLTRTSAGEIVNGVEATSTNFPIPDPNSNSIYYLRSADIYLLKFTIEDDTIKLTETHNGDGEVYGDLVVETSLIQDISGFDVGNIDTFFKIE